MCNHQVWWICVRKYATLNDDHLEDDSLRFPHWKIKHFSKPCLITLLLHIWHIHGFCHQYDSVDGHHIFIPPASTKLKGGYTGITLSVCPSVDRIASALYLQQYSSDPFHICTSYQTTSEGVSHVMPVANSKIWNFGEFFKFVTLTLSSFDLGSNMTQWYG